MKVFCEIIKKNRVIKVLYPIRPFEGGEGKAIIGF
jgi:hypothetical protein